MEKIFSILESNKLLHIIYRVNDFNDIQQTHRKDIVDSKEFIQLSALKMKEGQTFKPHQHIWKDGEKKVIAQESWVVIKGSVKCSFYDTDGTILKQPVLNAGDCSITLAGGHTYSILEDDTLVYEYKTGPYKGQENDKIFLDEI
tara:strand:+ start:872 stop:1303 length:432 start_codon:yes stop_codon:yes gene_type:complete